MAGPIAPSTSITQTSARRQGAANSSQTANKCAAVVFLGMMQVIINYIIGYTALHGANLRLPDKVDALSKMHCGLS